MPHLRSAPGGRGQGTGQRVRNCPVLSRACTSNGFGDSSPTSDTVLHAAGQLYGHIRAQRLPLHQFGQQPALHAGRRLDLQGRTTGADLLNGIADQVERLFDTRVQRLPLLGEAQSPCLTVKQRIPKMLFKPGNLTAHCPLSDM